MLAHPRQRRRLDTNPTLTPLPNGELALRGIGDLTFPERTIPGENERVDPARSASKPGFFRQLWSGTRLAAAILTPTWLFLWLGGTAVEQVAVSAGLTTPPPVTRPLPPSMLPLAQRNTTAFDGRAGTDTMLWNSLGPTLEILKAYSPDLHAWFIDLHARDKITFRTREFSSSSERYSDFRRWSGELVLYPGFFELSDGEKIVTLRHEREHADEGPGAFIANGLRPTVFAGAVVRAASDGTAEILSSAGRKDIAETISNWANEDGWPQRWQYVENRSEQAAVAAEQKTARELGLDCDSCESGQPDGETKIIFTGQELGGAGLAAYLLHRRRSKKKKTD